MPSKQHSYVSGRELKARGALALDSSAKVHSAELAKLGIGLVPVRPFATGMDTALTGPALTPGFVRPELMRTIMPGVIRELTQITLLDEITGVTVAGRWEDEELAWLTAQAIGKAELYGDLSNIPLASWNPGTETRGIVRGEQGMMYGLLEEARQTAAGFNTADEKRRAVRQSLEQFRNDIGWNGFAGSAIPVYGLLNDPGLGAYETMATWVGASFAVITGQLTTLFSDLEAQAGGNIRDDTALTLVLPLGYRQYLGVTNTAAASGQTVRQWITENFPNMRIIFAPEFVGANGGANVAYLFADSVGDGEGPEVRVLEQIVQTKYQLLGSEQRVKGYIEDATNATSGVVVTRPWGVVRGSGL